MKRTIAAVAIVAALTLTMAPAAQAAPHSGQRWTSAWGFIVWVQGGAFYMRSRCTWTAGNHSWHVSWLLSPHHYKWTTSDTGGWGDHRPRHLNCTFTRYE